MTRTTTRPTTKAAKARIVLDTLEGLFPQVEPSLDFVDPYTTLVAVLLSAQCTDARVNQVTPRLFALADTPRAMAALDVAQIENIIRPCGLAPRKARAIRDLSQILLDQHDSQVPQTLEELEELPGVGHKTAQVVVSQAFGQATFPVDTHIHRLAYRWGLSTGHSVERTERDLKRLFPEDCWNKLHLQLIYFGRQYCPARGHDPTVCPLCSRIGRRRMAR